MGYLEPQSRACEARRRRRNNLRRTKERKEKKKRNKKGNTKSVKNAVAPGATKGTGSSSSSSSLKLEQMFFFVWLLVSLVINFGCFAFLCLSASSGITPRKIPSPWTVKSFFMVGWNRSTPRQSGTMCQSLKRAGGNETGSNTVNWETTYASVWVHPVQKCRKCPSRCRTRERKRR